MATSIFILQGGGIVGHLAGDIPARLLEPVDQIHALLLLLPLSTDSANEYANEELKKNEISNL